MLKPLLDWVRRQAAARFVVLARVLGITFRPSDFAADFASGRAGGVGHAFRHFATCVGLLLVVEGVFSLAFDTEFSDIVHHSFPVLVVLASGVTVHLCLKLLLARSADLGLTSAASYYVGGSALLVTFGVVFAVLAVDFAAHSAAVAQSPCRNRTIICILSGGRLAEYNVPPPARDGPGASLPLVGLVLLAAALHYTHVFSTVLRTASGIARWRSYVAVLASVTILAPLSLLAINAIYRALYAAP